MASRRRPADARPGSCQRIEGEAPFPAGPGERVSPRGIEQLRRRSRRLLQRRRDPESAGVDLIEAGQRLGRPDEGQLPLHQIAPRIKGTAGDRLLQSLHAQDEGARRTSRSCSSIARTLLLSRRGPLVGLPMEERQLRGGPEVRGRALADRPAGPARRRRAETGEPTDRRRTDGPRDCPSRSLRVPRGPAAARRRRSHPVPRVPEPAHGSPRGEATPWTSRALSRRPKRGGRPRRRGRSSGRKTIDVRNRPAT